MGVTLIFDWLLRPYGQIIGTISSGDSASMPNRRDRDQVPSEYTTNSCPRRCTEDYYPICATNKLGESKVFVNDCYMAMENCNQSPQRGNFFFSSMHNLSIVFGVVGRTNISVIHRHSPSSATIFLISHDVCAHFQCLNEATDRIARTMANG